MEQGAAAALEKAGPKHQSLLKDDYSYGVNLILLAGCYYIGKFLYYEYQLGRKKCCDKGMMQFNWRDQIHYRLDYYLSTNELAKPVLLFSLTFFLVVIGAIALSVAEDLSISASAWTSWTYVADPGTHADAEGELVRAVSFLISIGGMLVFALMIGITSDALGEKVDDLKKGKARVVENKHTLILGWGDKNLAIIQQVATANESEGGGTIVVLARVDKEEMETSLRNAIEMNENPLRLLGTKVIFRSGNPLMEPDLSLVSVSTARAVICLSPDNVDPDDADSRMVRQVLALKAFGDVKRHIVVEMQDADNRELVEIVEPDLVEVVVAHDMIGRLMIQCARQPGLAVVIEALMGFVGDDLYFKTWPELTKRTFLQITCRFNDAIPIGVKTASGEIILNPANTYVIQDGDAILCLAEDDDSYTVNDGNSRKLLQSQDSSISDIPPTPTKTISPQPQQSFKKVLFCGWRRDMADMITQHDEYSPKGAELWLFNLVPPEERCEMYRDKGTKGELETENIQIKHVVGNPVVRRDLNKLCAVDENGNPTGDECTLDEFDSILILADSVATENGGDIQISDSRSLSSLLIIQDIQRKLLREKRKKDPSTVLSCCKPISEILDTRTRSLLSVAQCEGYIMSNQIISAAIAQIAEDRNMNAVLTELLQAEGSELYVRDISEYLDFDVLSSERSYRSFWDIALLVKRKDEIAVGYKPKDMSYVGAKENTLNPPNKLKKRRWERGDCVIVLARD